MTLGDFFVSEETLYNREAVRNSPVTQAPTDGDILIVYTYEGNRYKKDYLTFSLDNLAQFICSNEQDKLICTSDDYALLNTIGSFIDLHISNLPFKEDLYTLVNRYRKS